MAGVRDCISWSLFFFASRAQSESLFNEKRDKKARTRIPSIEPRNPACANAQGSSNEAAPTKHFVKLTAVRAVLDKYALDEDEGDPEDPADPLDSIFSQYTLLLLLLLSSLKGEDDEEGDCPSRLASPSYADPSLLILIQKSLSLSLVMALW